MPPAAASYIEVPTQVIPFYPNVPVPQEGAVLHQQQAQAGVSLVQNIGISHTERYPSDVARSVLDHMSSGVDDTGTGIVQSGEYFACYDFVQYLDLCERKGFRIKGYDTKSGKFVGVPLSYDNRWCPEHRKKLSVKLDRLVTLGSSLSG